MAFRDIRKSRRWLSAEEAGFLGLILFLLAAFLAANIFLSRAVPGGEWFFLRWSGVRAYLVENVEPYSTEIAQRTQEVAYGRRAFSSEYAFVLNDPFFIVLLYAPIVLIQNSLAGLSPSLASFLDFAFLRGLWMLFSQIALVGTVLLAINLVEWQPPRWLYAVLFLFGLFNYFSVNALLSGTPTIILGFLYVGILAALRSQSDELAGALLALVAYQWEVGGLFFLFILFMVVTNRRWGVLAGFGMALFILLAVSFMVYQGWGLPYIRAVISDWLRGANLTFGRILSNWLPDFRFSPGDIVALILGFILFIEWVGSVDAHFRRIVWTAALSLAMTPLMGFAIFPSNHVVLLLPFILILALVWERWQRRRVLYTIFIILLVLGVFYGLYIRSVSIYEPLVTDLMSVLPPISAIIALYWMRWWAVRSPRIWLDRIGEYG